MIYKSEVALESPDLHVEAIIACTPKSPLHSTGNTSSNACRVVNLGQIRCVGAEAPSLASVCIPLRADWSENGDPGSSGPGRPSTVRKVRVFITLATRSIVSVRASWPVATSAQAVARRQRSCHASPGMRIRGMRMTVITRNACEQQGWPPRKRQRTRRQARHQQRTWRARQ